MTPSVIIPASIAQHPRLSLKAKLVWGQIAFHRNRQTGQCNPRYKKIAEKLGTSEDTVCRAVSELRRYGLVTTQKHTRASSYTLHVDPVETTCGNPVEKTRSLRSQETAVCGRKKPQFAVAGGAPSLYEPELLNLNKGTRDAAVPATSIVGVEEKAAAAASPSPQMAFEFSYPASPPVADEVVHGAAEVHANRLAEDGRIADETRTQSAPRNDADAACSNGFHHRGPNSGAKGPRLEIAPEPPTVDVDALAAALTDKLIDVHPQPGLPQKARPYVASILWAAADPLEEAERIWENHRVWRDYWARLEAGKFIPQLWRWFDSQEWEKPPVIRKPATKATLGERTIEYMRRQKAAGLWRMDA